MLKKTIFKCDVCQNPVNLTNTCGHGFNSRLNNDEKECGLKMRGKNGK